MGNAGSDQTTPNPNTPFNGCTGLSGSNISDSSATDFRKIPSMDLYGNSLTGTGYQNSHIVDSAGHVSSIYSNTELDRTQKVNNYHWGLAIWNGVDNTAANIRADSNLPNRPGDIQNMQVAIYTIGYLGNGGIDDGLLKRVANDKTSTSYDAEPGARPVHPGERQERARHRVRHRGVGDLAPLDQLTTSTVRR